MKKATKYFPAGIPEKVVILINRLSQQPTPDEIDVLDQVVAVEGALEEAGISHEREFIDLNLDQFVDQIKQGQGIVAFNLVESLNNDGGLVYFVPALLESLKIPFTGNPSDALFLTTHKPLAKKFMAMNGIPTPGWWNAWDDFVPDKNRQYMAKPSREDASVGITDENVFSGDNPGVIESFKNKWGSNFFIEEFISGREFNLSILGGPDGPEVLAPAEIIFQNFPPGKPAIVGYAAKWDESTFEYRNTVRSFDFPDSDSALLEALKTICYRCWSVFNLRGYARVDFRVDPDGRPNVLEINANPCISPDSGFYNAALRNGYTFAGVVKRIITDL